MLGDLCVGLIGIYKKSERKMRYLSKQKEIYLGYSGCKWAFENLWMGR